MADLRPYLCTSRRCKEAESTYTSKGRYAEHMISEHGISIHEMLATAECIFCGENVGYLSARHIGRHMEEIAFAVVAKPYEDWEFYSDPPSRKV